MATFPNDQFDNLPDNVDRVGAHRGPKVRGRGWIGFGWAVLATVVLVLAGLVVLNILNGQGFTGNVPSETDTATSTPTPTITPVIDPSHLHGVSVSVLNATATVGLEKTAAAKLKSEKWHVTSTAVAEDTSFKKTTVYYSLASNKAIALGIAQDLGIGVAVQVVSTQYPGATITVVLGTDYKG